jgi:methionyl-tRNA formyltransferase
LTLGGEVRKLKIYPYAEVGPDHHSTPGTVILSDTQLVVSCGEGRLILNGDLQLEGRKRMSSADLLRGIEIPIGLILR